MIQIVLIIFILLLLLIYYKNKKWENFKQNENKYNNYRLGDIVSGFIRKKNINNYNKFRKTFPNTIASKYINKTSKLPEKEKDFNFKILSNICNHSKKDLVKNDYIVVHLRLGDSLIDKINNKYIFLEKGKIAHSNGFFQPSDFQKLIDLKLKNHNCKKVFLVYGFHNSNFNKKITEDYVHDIKKIFSNNGYIVKEKTNGNPDEDFQNQEGNLVLVYRTKK